MGADGSSGSSQQCPRDEAELRYNAQRGKVPGTLQKNKPENMTAGKQGMKGKAGTTWLISWRELLSARGTADCPADVEGKLPNYLVVSFLRQGSCASIARMIKEEWCLELCASHLPQGCEPCLLSWAAGAWATKLWLTFPHGWTVLLIRKTHTFYVQTLSFPSCHRKGFRHIILASRKTPNSVSGIWCFPASPAMHPSAKKW